MGIRVLFVTCLAITISISSFGQFKRLSFGPKVGMMVGAPIPHGSNPAIENASGEPLMGPNVGIFFLYHFTPKWSIWVEGNYNRKATNYRASAKDLYYVDEQCIPLPDGTERCAEIETIFNGDTWGKFDNWYFEIPIMARYSFSEKWHLLGGGYYSSLNKSESVVYYDGIIGASPTKTKSERELASVTTNHDAGLMLGFHYQYKPILVDFRMSYAFNSIIRDDYRPIEYPIKNVFAQLSVAFQFFRYHPDHGEEQ